MERYQLNAALLLTFLLSGCATGQTFFSESLVSHWSEIDSRSSNSDHVVLPHVEPPCTNCLPPCATSSCSQCGETTNNSGLAGGFAHGRPNRLLDGAGWVFGIPSKLLLWSTRVDSHEVSAQTQQQLRQYLATRGLNDVKVRVNQYDPIDEWKRLTANKSIHPGWKYTVGALAVTRYSMLPGRLFGGDDYNPFTNTISLYSDRASLALREGARAKRATDAEYRGLYSASMYLPGNPLWVDTRATREVLAWTRETNQPDLERESYLVLFPAHGARLGRSFTFFLDPGAGQATQATFAFVGHAVGRTMAFRSSETPMEMVKSVYGIVKRPQTPGEKNTVDVPEARQAPTALPAKFIPMDVVYDSAPDKT